jgi:hypothetical protein
VIGALRAADWWDYKLTPPLAVLWATTMRGERSLLSSWRVSLALVGALAVCAAYVSVINDLFDRDDDVRSGKANRLLGLSNVAIGAVISACVAAGLLFVATWRADPARVGVYVGSWVAFTMYSAPPLRLKTRGLPGVLADAAGASLCPCLLAVLLATHSPDPLWLGAVAMWALGSGLRGILGHQMADIGPDRIGGVSTFAARHGASRTLLVSRDVALPLEIAGLAAMTWLTRSALPPLFLLFAIGLAAARRRIWGSTLDTSAVLDEYNDALLPVALVLASARAHPADLWLLPFLLLAFGRIVRPFRDAAALSVIQIRRALARSRAGASTANAKVNASDPQ